MALPAQWQLTFSKEGLTMDFPAVFMPLVQVRSASTKVDLTMALLQIQLHVTISPSLPVVLMMVILRALYRHVLLQPIFI